MGMGCQSRTEVKVNEFEEGGDERIGCGSTLAAHKNHLGGYKISQSIGPSEIRISMNRTKAAIFLKVHRLRSTELDCCLFCLSGFPRRSRWWITGIFLVLKFLLKNTLGKWRKWQNSQHRKVQRVPNALKYFVVYMKRSLEQGMYYLPSSLWEPREASYIRIPSIFPLDLEFKHIPTYSF